jgi:DNA-binding transcriptional LysR family regulator
MDIWLLVSYVTLARRLSFTEAARELCITQPTLSKQIAAIEKEVGARLIDRGKQSLALTHAGTVYLEGASAVLARYNRTLAEISALTKDGGRFLSITGFIYAPLQAALKRFREEYPSIRLKIKATSIPGELDMFLNKEIDACFGVYFPQLVRPDIRFHPLGYLPFCVVVGEGHRLAGREKIHIAELENESFITRLEDSPDLNLGLVEMLTAHGFSPHSEMRCSSSLFELLIDLQGAVLPWVSGQPLPGIEGTRITMIEIEEDDFKCEYGVWYHENSSNPALPLLLEELTTWARL